MERNVAFLADELKVVDAKTAEDRVFFVSAKEAVISRIHQEKGTPTPSKKQISPVLHCRPHSFCSYIIPCIVLASRASGRLLDTQTLRNLPSGRPKNFEMNFLKCQFIAYN